MKLKEVPISPMGYCSDPLMAGILDRERERQEGQIELIASENIVSRSVLEALSSVITNKTVEGYPGACYHAGAKVVDEAEQAAIQRATALFGFQYATCSPIRDLRPTRPCS